MQRVVGRVATRRKHPEKAQKKRKPEKEAIGLEQRIQEAEQKKLALERRITRAFEHHDYQEGRRAARQLERLEAQIDDLYERWIEENEA
jgi:predicted  nucleic acid-binding Zn-ribbon protein